MCDEPASEAGREVRQVVREVRQEAVEGQVGIGRPQRTRNMSERLQECPITSDDVVNNEGELVHYAFYADTGPVNVVEALKDSRWMKAMVDNVKSIEDNGTWSLVEFLKGKKGIDVKWVYKFKLNPTVQKTHWINSIALSHKAKFSLLCKHGQQIHAEAKGISSCSYQEDTEVSQRNTQPCFSMCMPNNIDDEVSRRNYREESWSNDHEDRQHVDYQPDKESDNTR
ncbi:hypothetical protein KIW84_060256 [Lathyrus oleraceus]|uniref:Uncharacterized protein n=1 Tax=Pisum sativum TaxID=3888 RepID=A0A9D4W1U0_PEA|nr:hypothetical protein KIW84_060256 [Pisum sativum]